MKAGVYVRISRDLAGDGQKVANQEEDGRALADRLGWDVVEVYTDNDISATSGKPRPAYRRMLADLRAGRIDAIVAWHPDRLYRRALDLVELVELVQKHDVRVATVQAGDLDLASPTGLLVAELLASVAMYEVRHKAERWSRSWQQRRQSGTVARTGSRLFGYACDMTLIDAEFITNPENKDRVCSAPKCPGHRVDEVTIARRMAADVIAGSSIQGVARWLEQEGIPATRGNPWRPAGVRTYLSNPKLAGYSTMSGEIVGEGQWVPILDRDTWETVRALLMSRQRVRPPRVALLGGLVFCGTCGHRLITSAYGRGGDRTYRCPNRPGLRGCGRVSGLAAPIEELVEAFAVERFRDPRVETRVGELTSTTGAGDLLAEIGQLEARVIELDAELDKPGVPVARLTRALDRATARLEDARRELADATAAAHARHTSTAYAGGMPWPDDLATRRQLVSVALGDRRVWLDPSRPGVWNPSGFDTGRVRITRDRQERADVPTLARAR